MCTGHMLICCFEKIKTINPIKDAQKLKFLAEGEKKETLGRIPNTVFLIFCPYFASFSPLHTLNSQNVLFTVLFCFSEKNLLQNNN